MAAILRIRKCFTGELANLYTIQMISYLEYRTAAIYNECNTTLQRLDNFQEHFLSELGISVKTALFVFNLAPLACRRDIAMLE